MSISIIHSTILRSLPAILDVDPSLIKTHVKELQSTLSNDYKDVLNIDEMLKAEGAVFYTLEKKHPFHASIVFARNAAENNYVEVKEAVKSLLTLPYDQIAMEATSLQSQYMCAYPNILNCLPNYFYKYSIGENLRYLKHIILIAHQHSAHQRAMILWLEAKVQNIPADNMDEFLKAAPQDLHNPMTNEPFVWNEDNNAIYYGDSDGENINIAFMIFY